MSPDDAKELISFSEMLLRFMYEFPARVKAKAAISGEEAVSP